MTASLLALAMSAPALAAKPKPAPAAPSGEPTDLLPGPMLGMDPALELPDAKPQAEATSKDKKRARLTPNSAPPAPAVISPIPVAVPTQQPFPPVLVTPVPSPPPVSRDVPPPVWTLADAQALLKVVEGIGAQGLFPSDYDLEALRASIAAGESLALNEVATRAFTKLAVDLRDGRTPYQARVQWFVKDPDTEAMPTATLLADALARHDVSGVLAGLEPAHPDYAALKAALAKTASTDSTKRATIRTNLDRWRWLPRNLGDRYVAVNVPEYMVRVVNKGRNVSTYRGIVGKPNTATPQLAEMATGVIFHPTWTIPRSIIKESVGALIASRPAVAKARGYRWTGEGASLSVVQAPGPGNSLGVMKLDMPNPHAIFLHDTPARGLFANDARALSHGCVRTDRAQEFGILLSILQTGMDAHEAAEIIKAGENARVEFTTPIPVYIAYFTLGSGGDGVLAPFADIYGRDAPVVASFAKPREEKLALPKQEIIANDRPGT